MRVLVVSDIHANLAALEAVETDARRLGYDTVWCLGDVIGYGPEPNACVQWLRDRAALTVVGNHDWAALGRMDIHDFNREAARAVLWTREHLSATSLAWLNGLPSQPLVQDAYTLTHGSPRDPVWEYVHNAVIAQHNFTHYATAICLVGHTHVPLVHARADDQAAVKVLHPKPDASLDLATLGRAILNPGSVGQPRDNDPRAAYALLDTSAATWTLHRVTYPIEITQAHMRAEGLPERLINRLSFGW